MGFAKILAILVLFVALVAMVTAISLYGNTNFKRYNAYNITNVSAEAYYYNNGTQFTGGAGGWTALATSNLNMSHYNITDVTCIYFLTGNICG